MNSTDLIVTLETDKIAPFLWLETDVDGQFSDNGFTLREKNVELVFSNREDPIDVEEFKSTLTTRSLFSYL